MEVLHQTSMLEEVQVFILPSFMSPCVIAHSYLIRCMTPTF